MQHVGIIDVPTDLAGKRAEQREIVVEGCPQLGSRFPEADADETHREQGHAAQETLCRQQPLDGEISEHPATGEVRRPVGRAGTNGCTDNEIPATQAPPGIAGRCADPESRAQFGFIGRICLMTAASTYPQAPVHGLHASRPGSPLRVPPERYPAHRAGGPDWGHTGWRFQVTNQSFIVTLAVTTEEFRRTLSEAIPTATLLRELSRNRVVVLIPATSAAALATLAGVNAVTPDELAKKLRPGRQGGS